MIPFLTGYILDLILGDPSTFHPIIIIGKIIGMLEKNLRKFFKSAKEEKFGGILLWLIVTTVSFLIPFIILRFLYKLNNILGIIIESIMCFYILSAKSLKSESMKVYYALKNNDINEAKKYLSYIVGRDTNNLDEESIIKATIETISENTSDGVIAPMLFIILGGAPLGFLYKSVNTLDSMVGYKNDKYINLGKFSAIADDLFNFLPSRISALLMIAAAYFLKLNYKNAIKIFKRDRYNHKSPNSAQTESVCAGALNIQLGGDSYYKGLLIPKPHIGNYGRKAEIEDIKRANTLMLGTSFLCLISGLIIIAN